MFEWTPIDNEVDRVGADPTIIQQGGAFRGRAVCRNCVPGRFEIGEQRSQPRAQVFNGRRESRVERELLHAERGLLCRERGHRRRNRQRRAREACCDTKAAAMDRNPLDIANGQPLIAARARQCPEREVTEMLVIDRVELEALDEVAHIWHLDNRAPARLEQRRDAANYAGKVRYVREHVVGVQHAGDVATRAQLDGEGSREELGHRRNSSLFRDGGDVPRRIDAKHSHAAVAVVLQKVAVVARDLDGQIAGTEAVPLDGTDDERFGALYGRIRGGGDVRIVSKQIVWRDGGSDLNERAVGAKDDIQRIPTLGNGDAVRVQ